MRLEEQQVPLSANVLTEAFDARIEQPIEILDSTLREGEQTPGVVFTPDEKLEIAHRLDEVGVHWISVGFPIVSAEERAMCKRLVEGGFRFKTAALCRLRPDDVDATVDCGVDLVSLFVGGSDSHLFDKLRMTEAEAYEKIETTVARVKEQGALAAFGVEDFSRTPFRRLVEMLRIAADAGADQLTLPDTLGVLTPASTRRLVRALRAALPGVPLVLHFHDDLGLALANTLAGLEAGAEGVHATVGGLGERTGNTCLEELAVVLRVKYGRDLGLRLDRLTELAETVYRAAGFEPAPHKPVIGKNAFRHESGIHVAGLLANREAYQPYPPSLVGRHHEIVFGKHSGAQGLRHLAERHGLPLDDDACRRVLERIKTTAEARKAPIPEKEIVGWVEAAAPVAV